MISRGFWRPYFLKNLGGPGEHQEAENINFYEVQLKVGFDNGHFYEVKLKVGAQIGVET